MSKIRLLQAVCTIAMLSAAPAFAEDIHSGVARIGQPPDVTAQNTPAQNDNAPAMTPSDQSSGNVGQPGMNGSGMNGTDTMRSSGAMPHTRGAMRGTSDSSQSAEVDRLNEQSLNAARNGQAFNGSGGGASSGSMNDMSGGTMESGQTGPSGATGSGR